MTEQEYKEAKRKLEVAQEEHGKAIENLNDKIAKLSEEYLEDLIHFDVDGYYLIDNSFIGFRIYFKWTEDSKLEYDKTTNTFIIMMKKIIIVREDGISVLDEYHYCTSPDRLINEIHKIEESKVKDIVAYVTVKTKKFL